MFDNFFNQSDAMRQRFSDLEWKELQRTFMDGGYYKYKHNDKLTIISLDTNYWHSSNMKSIDYRAGWRQMYFL